MGGRGLVGALIAHHGETERRKCISRSGDGCGGRADITQETVGGTPPVEMPGAAGQPVYGRMDIELFGRQHAVVAGWNLGDQVAHLGLERGAQLGCRPMIEKDLGAVWIPGQLRGEAELAGGIRSVSDAPAGDSQLGLVRVCPASNGDTPNAATTAAAAEPRRKLRRETA